MPSKNNINRPKIKNHAASKAQRKSAIARRRPQTAILFGKVDSKKVMQKKLRRSRIQAAQAAAAPEDGKDAAMHDEDEEEELEMSLEGVSAGIDTKAKKMARKAAIAQHNSAAVAAAATKEFKMETTGPGTTLGGPPR